MAKIFTYVILIVGLMVLFNLAGLNTTIGYVLGEMGLTEPSNLPDAQSIPLWVLITGTITSIAGIVLVVVSFVRGNITMLPLTATLALTLILFVGDLTWIVASLESGWAQNILYLIATPLIIGYVIALYDWIRSSGSD